MSERLTFVSVVFEAEFPFAVLQARSFARYVGADMVEEILVIDNSSGGMPAAVRKDMLEAFGPLAARVDVLRPEDICRIPASIGWRSQQVLKLSVAARVRTELFVVLDAKNIFVAPPGDEFFRAADGRPRVTAYSYRNHPLRPALEHVLHYLGIDPAPHIERFPATVTPFVLVRSVVLDLIAAVESRSGRSFAEEFVRQELTEFFLYSGSILAAGKELTDVSEINDLACPTVWPRSADVTGMKAAIARAETGALPVFSVHRKAFGLLDHTSLELLAEFWTARGLFPDLGSARTFGENFRSGVRGQERRRRIREARHRIPAKVRGLARRMSDRGRAR